MSGSQNNTQQQKRIESEKLMYSCGNRPKRGDFISLRDKMGMNAEAGAKARVKGITEINNVFYIDIIWLDESSHNQSNGGYLPDNFRLLHRWVEQVAIDKKSEIIQKWSEEDYNRFVKFYKIVEVMGMVSFLYLGEELGLNEKEFRDRVWDWAYMLDYKVNDDHVCIR